MLPEEELAASLKLALWEDFTERDASARQLAELLLDAIAAAIPLTQNEPVDTSLAQLRRWRSRPISTRGTARPGGT